MSVNLDSVTFRNFLSYSNTPTTYNFEEGITRLSGRNGNGKSVLVDVIYYALFGKPYRKINLPKLVNSINKKGLLVELIFHTQNNKFKVERGIKPNIFKIFKNGVLVDIDSSYKDYQQYLEEDILQFSEDIFQQIGVKSLTRYDSFLTLPKGKKRQIIESIFGLTVLTEMKDLNKEDIDVIETNIYNFKKEISKYEMLKEQELRNLEKLKQLKSKILEKTKKERQEKLKKINDIKIELKRLKKGIDIIEKNKKILVGINDEINNNSNLNKKINKELKPIKKALEEYLGHCLFMSERCSGCPDLQSIIQDKDNEELKQKEIGLNKKIEELKQKEIELNEKYSSIEKLTLNEPVIKLKLNTKIKEIKGLEKDLEESDTEDIIIDEVKLNQYVKKIKEINSKITNSFEKMEYLNVIHQILDDTGIKSHIIKRYLPLLNKLMNTFLVRFGIDLEMSFTSDLDIEILTKFKESYAYESFSEGEKRRINLALTFTFLEFCKLKYSTSSLNVLILDEFSTGLDPEGENVLYEVLKDMVGKEQKEIITISHSTMIDPEKIKRLFLAERNRGFSTLTLSEEI